MFGVRAASIRMYAKQIPLLLIPLIALVAVWAVVARPQQRKLRDWKDELVLTQLKPVLETLVTDSQEVVATWEQQTFRVDDPSAVTQAVQRLADTYRVQLKAVNSTGQPAESSSVEGFAAMPLELEASGRFNKLSQWMSAMEATPGLLIDTFTITPSQGDAQSHQLKISLTAYLRKT